MKFLKDGNGFVMGCNGQQIHPLSQLFTLNQGSWLKDQHQPVSVSRVLCALEILYKEVPRENQECRDLQLACKACQLFRKRLKNLGC